jgi:hypothetical protein
MTRLLETMTKLALLAYVTMRLLRGRDPEPVRVRARRG